MKKTFNLTVFLLLFTILKVSGKNYEWAWMYGDSNFITHAHYGIKGVPSINNYPGFRYWTMNWKDTSNNFWVFGGFNIQANKMNDLWRYDFSTNEWTWMSGDTIVNQHGVYSPKGVSSPINTPGARQKGITWVDKENNLWLYGGDGYVADTLGYINDFWKYNISTNEWTWVNGDSNGCWQFGDYGTKGVYSILNNPAARRDAGSWTDSVGNLWLFGGQTPSWGSRNDLWKYDISLNQWMWVKGDMAGNEFAVWGTKGVPDINSKPRGKSAAVYWIDNFGNFWVWGNGQDMWRYEMATNTWTWMSGDTMGNIIADYGEKFISAPNNIPPAISSGASNWVDYDNNLWLYGGYSIGLNSRNTLWKYNTIINEWTWVGGDDTVNNLAYSYGVQGVFTDKHYPSQGYSFRDKMGNFWLLNNYLNFWKLNICGDDLPNITRSGSTLISTNVFSNYQWYRNDTLIVGANGPSLSLSQEAVYYLVVTDSIGCETKSNIISTITGIGDVNVMKFIVSPNPSTGIFYIEGKKEFQYEVIDVLGKKVVEDFSLNRKGTINLFEQPKGIYFIRIITSDNENEVVKLLLQ